MDKNFTLKTSSSIEKKKEEMNYEKVYMSILELKQESQKTLTVSSEFFHDYIQKNQSCNPTEVLNFLSKLEENKATIKSSKSFIYSLLDLTKKIRFLLEKRRIRTEKIISQNSFVRTYLQISSTLNKNKRKYTENVQMSNSEMKCLNYYLHSKGEVLKNMQKELLFLDEKISQTKTENKTLCAREYELMSKIISTEKQLLESADQRNKNAELLKRKENEYKLLGEKMKDINKIKENILASVQIKKTNLMRTAFKLKKFNDEFRINTQVNQMLSSREVTNVRNFTMEEAIIFSEMFDRLKEHYPKKKEQVDLYQKEKGDKSGLINREKENFKMDFLRLVSYVSCNYEEIKIENFSVDLKNLQRLSEVLADVNMQLGTVYTLSALQHQSFDLERKNLKFSSKSFNDEVVKKLASKKNAKLKRKSFNILRSLAKILRDARERERKAAELKQEKEKENALRMKEREILNKEAVINNISNASNNILNNANNIETQGNKKKRGGSRDREGAKKDVKSKKIKTTNTNNMPLSTVDNSLSSQSNYFSSNAANNTINNISTSNLSSIPSQQQKFNLKVDINSIEESFNKKTTATYDSSNFLDEISKSIRDVTDFGAKNTFGEKKKRYMNSLNFNM